MYLLLFVFSGLKVRWIGKTKYAGLAVPLLILFLAGKCIDLAIFTKPNFSALQNKDLPFNEYIYPYDKFSPYSVESAVAVPVKIKKNEIVDYFITSPCYRWDVK